jgi:hypothetical protein
MVDSKMAGPTGPRKLPLPITFPIAYDGVAEAAATVHLNGEDIDLRIEIEDTFTETWTLTVDSAVDLALRLIGAAMRAARRRHGDE